MSHNTTLICCSRVQASQKHRLQPIIFKFLRRVYKAAVWRNRSFYSGKQQSMICAREQRKLNGLLLHRNSQVERDFAQAQITQICRVQLWCGVRTSRDRLSLPLGKLGIRTDPRHRSADKLALFYGKYGATDGKVLHSL